MNTTGQKNFWFITGIILLGALLRATYLITPAISSDQATFGLQGIHVLKGEFPIFSWGYAYIGTLQSYIDAAMFYLFGVSRTVLNGTVLLFYIAYGYSLYYLSKSISEDFFWQACCVLLGAVAPAYFMIHGAWARHGYPETYLFGTLIMAIACNELQKPTRLRTYAIVSFIAGLAWWTNFLVIYYFPPLALFFAFKLFSEKRLTDKIKIFSAGLISFIAGSLPFWVHNLRNDFDSLSMFNKEPESAFLEKFFATFSQVLPIIFGTEDVENDHPASLVLKVIFLLLAFVLIFFFFYEGSLFFKKLFSRKVTPQGLLWLLLASIFSIFMLNYSQANGSNARYLIPLYTLYPLMIVSFLQLLTSYYRMRLSSLIFFSAILCTNFYSFWSGSPLFHKEIRTSYSNEIQSEMQFFEALKKTGKKNFLMNDYWKSYRFTFDAREELIFENIDTRYPPYLYRMLQGNDFNYLLTEKEREWENGFKALGFAYRTEKIPGGLIYTDFRSLFPCAMDAVDPQDIACTFLGEKRELACLTDRNFSSVQSYRADETDQETLLFHFSSPVELSGMSLYATKDHPFVKRLQLTDADTKETIFDMDSFCTGRVCSGKPYTKYNSPYFEVFFKPIKVKKVEFRLTGPREKSDKKIIPMLLREIFFFKRNTGNIPGNLPMLREILGKTAYDRCSPVYCCPGASQTVLDYFKKARSSNEREIIDFSLPALLVCENRFFRYNKEQLEKAGIPFHAYEGQDFSLIRAHGKKDIKALWMAGNAVIYYSDKKLSKKYLLLGEKAFCANQDADALNFLNTSLHYLKDNMPAFTLLKEFFGRKGNLAEEEKYQSLIEGLNKTDIGADVVYGRRIRLHGFNIDKDTTSPGETIEIEYIFESLKDGKNDFQAFIHFSTPEEKILFQNDHILETGSMDDNILVKGEIIRDLQRIKIPKNPGYSGKVSIWLGLWYPKKQKRMEAETQLEDHANRVKIGEITLLPGK